MNLDIYNINVLKTKIKVQVETKVENKNTSKNISDVLALMALTGNYNETRCYSKDNQKLTSEDYKKLKELEEQFDELIFKTSELLNLDKGKVLFK